MNFKNFLRNSTKLTNASKEISDKLTQFVYFEKKLQLRSSVKICSIELFSQTKSW